MHLLALKAAQKVLFLSPSMSSTYGWLTESALAFERPVPLRGVSQRSQLLLASIVKKHQASHEQQLAEQRPLFAAAAREGKVFTHDAECDRRWTRPTKRPLDWAERQLAGKNEGVGFRNAADERERKRVSHDLSAIEEHLERKAKLYDHIVGGAGSGISALQLLQPNRKRRVAQSAKSIEKEAGPQLSTEAMAELLDLTDGLGAGVGDKEAAQQQTTRLSFLQARLNLYRHVLSLES